MPCQWQRGLIKMTDKGAGGMVVSGGVEKAELYDDVIQQT